MRRHTASARAEMDLAAASMLGLAAAGRLRQIVTMDARDLSRYRLPDGRGFEIP